MARFVLGKVKVASPCKSNWDEMEGDERVRFCAQCQKKVYNLSHMSRPAAEDLIIATEGQLCVRFYQRADGKVLTSEDCPVGMAAVARRKLLMTAAQVAAGAVTLAGGLAGLLLVIPLPEGVRTLPGIGRVVDSLRGVVDSAPDDVELLRRYRARLQRTEPSTQHRDITGGFGGLSEAS